MSLTKLFNAKYFYQNMRKSAQWLVVFVGLIPILNTIIFLLEATYSGSNYVATLGGISAFTIFGMFIFPFVLAACLFDFIFKKKSVDFMGSMPISKRCIFTTNMIGGSLVIIVMLFVTGLLMWISSLFFTTVTIPFLLLLDYFLLALVGYLFVFAAASLGFAASGNMITGIIVTLLLLFLLPFSKQYVLYSVNRFETNTAYIGCDSDACIPEVYSCMDNSSCREHKRDNEYAFFTSEMKDQHIYSLPYSFVSNILWVNPNGYSIEFDGSQILLTFCLTIIYIGIGYYVFSHKKLEITETSFGNFYHHFFVKVGTLVPICTVIYELMNVSSIFFFLFLLAMLIAYCFIYDLITRKKIEFPCQTILYFLGSVAILLGSSYIINHITFIDNSRVFEENNISKIVYEDSSEKGIQIYDIEDKTLKAKVLSLLTNSKASCEQECFSFPITLIVKGKEYTTELYLTSEETQNLREDLKESATLRDISFNHVYAASIGDFYLTAKDRKNLLKIAPKEEELESCLVNQTVYMYTYKHHRQERTAISSCRSLELQQLVAQYTNQEIAKTYPEWGFVSVIYPPDPSLTLLFKYYSEDISDFVIRHLDDPVDISKDMIVLHIGYYSDAQEIKFYTNAKEEFFTFVDHLKEEASNDKEYQSWLESWLADDLENDGDANE